MKDSKIPVAREGYPFIIVPALVTLLLALAGTIYPAILFLAISLFMVYFFRNPEREVPEDDRAVVSPADGKVIKIERVREEEYLKAEALKVSIFMSVFNVHINRIPFPTRVVEAGYHPGKFFVASEDKASVDNERQSLLLETEGGKRLLLNQIAGVVARRIVCHAREGEYFEKGQRFGLIRFGSRVEILLPPETELLIREGDRVKGGQSIVGYLR
ncbi:MAG: phosphatidylserine decarboxylase family protein [Deltaproteobacteria bacterium]|nr:MAG: phosphatidylserine decarboxylase family protein [Deltaproteobacteria bacterium]